MKIFYVYLSGIFVSILIGALFSFLDYTQVGQEKIHATVHTVSFLVIIPGSVVAYIVYLIVADRKNIMRALFVTPLVLLLPAISFLTYLETRIGLGLSI